MWNWILNRKTVSARWKVIDPRLRAWLLAMGQQVTWETVLYLETGGGWFRPPWPVFQAYWDRPVNELERRAVVAGKIPKAGNDGILWTMGTWQMPGS